MNLLMKIRQILQESNPDNTGGGSGTPTSSTPSPSPSSSPSPGSGDSKGDDFDFGELATYDEGSGDQTPNAPKGDVSTAPKTTPPSTSQVPPSQAAAPSVPVVPAVPPGQQPPVAPQAPPQVPPATAQQPPQPTQAPQVPPVNQPPQAPASQPTPEQQSVTFEQHRAQFLPKLRELYKLTPEEAEKFKENPGEALPDLAARLHYETQLATYNSVMAVIPQVFHMMHEQRRVHEDANNKFYGTWPELKKVVDADPRKEVAIKSAIQAIRAANPGADMDSVIKQAGLVASMSLGLPVNLPANPGAVHAAQPHQQAPGQPVGNGLPPRPPGVGATGHIVPQTNGPAPSGDEGSLFADLADDFLKHGL